MCLTQKNLSHRSFPQHHHSSHVVENETYLKPPTTSIIVDIPISYIFILYLYKYITYIVLPICINHLNLNHLNWTPCHPWLFISCRTHRKSIELPTSLFGLQAASLRLSGHQFLHVALQQQHGLLPDASTSRIRMAVFFDMGLTDMGSLFPVTGKQWSLRLKPQKTASKTSWRCVQYIKYIQQNKNTLPIVTHDSSQKSHRKLNPSMNCRYVPVHHTQQKTVSPMVIQQRLVIPRSEVPRDSSRSRPHEDTPSASAEASRIDPRAGGWDADADLGETVGWTQIGVFSNREINSEWTRTCPDIKSDQLSHPLLSTMTNPKRHPWNLWHLGGIPHKPYQNMKHGSAIFSYATLESQDAHQDLETRETLKTIWQTDSNQVLSKKCSAYVFLASRNCTRPPLTKSPNVRLSSPLGKFTPSREVLEILTFLSKNVPPEDIQDTFRYEGAQIEFKAVFCRPVVSF